MKKDDFKIASQNDISQFIVKPFDVVPLTELVPGSDSHLVFGRNISVSFLTMKAGSIFDLHSHPEEQVMLVMDGFCDEVIDGKIYRVSKGDVIWLPSNIVHGAFLGEVDCNAIDIFSPPRIDYSEKFYDQHPGLLLKFANPE